MAGTLSVSSDPPPEADVVVAGSGAAGLTAALAAASAGAHVVVLEASRRWGGTTALSGAQVWVPNNHRMAQVNQSDSLEEALTYCRRHAPGRDPQLVLTFLRAAPAMLRFVEANAPLRFSACRIPDSFAEGPGGRAAGRHVEPEPVALADLGAVEDLVWPAPYPMVLTNEEISSLDLIGGGSFPTDLIQQRMTAGEVCMGLGLVVGLLRGCQDAGVTLIQGCRVARLHREEGRIAGVETQVDGARRTITARRGVVLATGGFEWDPELVGRMQGEPAALAVSPPVNHGDALRLAGEVGAALAHTDESWFWPVLAIPGEVWDDGSSRPRLVVTERGRPRVIWVNQAGHRFVDESSHNCALALRELDPGTNAPRNLPAWAVGDSEFRARYPIAGAAAEEPPPSWLTEADSLEELAERCGIDSAGLVETVERFNDLARTGHDRDFGRGSSAYDRSLGDPAAPHPNLGPIDEPPFFAVRIHLGTVGTKGGLRTDERGRVLAWSGEPIPGLHAAGNAMASVIGPGTIAPGLTLGQAMTWGWIAGTTVAGTAVAGTAATDHRRSAGASTVTLRRAGPDDAADVAAIWHLGWRDGHLGFVPQELVEVRTEESFRARAAARVGDTTVAVVDDAVAGFIMVVDDEIEQVYVSAVHRGTGVAAALIGEAERQVRATGHARAWLAVAPGNARARAFYARAGWHDEGLFDYPAAAEDGPIAVPCHRYAKVV